jgi:hypothetical protein
MLSAFTMPKIGSAKVLQIRQHQSKHTTWRQDTPAFGKKVFHLVSWDMFEKMGGIN